MMLNLRSQSSQVSKKRGFIALVAVMLLSLGALAFSLVVLSVVGSYSDTITARELRIQSRLTMRSCLDVVDLILAKDFYTKGSLSIPDFGCTVNVTSPYPVSGYITILATTTQSGVKAYGNQKVAIIGMNVSVASEEIN